MTLKTAVKKYGKRKLLTSLTAGFNQETEVTKKLTLLEQAKESSKVGRKGREYNLEEEELCMAWLSGDVTLTQVTKAMRFSTVQHAYTFLALCSRQLFGKARPKR